MPLIVSGPCVLSWPIPVTLSTRQAVLWTLLVGTKHPGNVQAHPRTPHLPAALPSWFSQPGVFVHTHAHHCLVRPRPPHACRSIHRAVMKAKVRILFTKVLNDSGPGRLRRASSGLALLALQLLVPPEPKGHQAPGHSRGPVSKPNTVS